MIQAPIFHVNGDDPEACVRVAQARLRVPPGVQEGRRHRHGLLPAPRAQRGRRPVDDPAADVHPDRGQALGAQALHRVAHRSRRHLGRGGRAGAARLPGPAGAGVRRDPRGDRGSRTTRAPARASSRRPSSSLDGRHAGRARPPSPLEVVKRDRRRARRPARRLHGAPEADAAAAEARRDGRPRAASTGRWASCSRSARCCSRASRCGSPARTAVAARSSSGTPS